MLEDEIKKGGHLLLFCKFSGRRIKENKRLYRTPNIIGALFHKTDEEISP